MSLEGDIAGRGGLGDSVGDRSGGRETGFFGKMQSQAATQTADRSRSQGVFNALRGNVGALPMRSVSGVGQYDPAAQRGWLGWDNAASALGLAGGPLGLLGALAYNAYDYYKNRPIEPGLEATSGQISQPMAEGLNANYNAASNMTLNALAGRPTRAFNTAPTNQALAVTKAPETPANPGGAITLNPVNYTGGF